MNRFLCPSVETAECQTEDESGTAEGPCRVQNTTFTRSVTLQIPQWDSLSTEYFSRFQTKCKKIIRTSRKKKREREPGTAEGNVNLVLRSLRSLSPMLMHRSIYSRH